jgi:hypothetical protein
VISVVAIMPARTTPNDGSSNARNSPTVMPGVAMKAAVAALSAALATQAGLPEPIETEGVLPARLAPLWGPARPAIEEFLRNQVRPTTAALEAAEGTRSRLASRILPTDTARTQEGASD